MSLDTDPPTPIQPLVALRALLALRRDPQDTRQVFILGEAIKGKSPFTLLNRFRRDPMGQERLRERRKLIDTLQRTDWLASLPEGTLGRTYHAFLAEENLSAQGLVEVSMASGMTMPDDGSDRHFIGRQLRDMHDLFHVLSGYGRDELGEVCVLAFSYPHQGTRSFALIATLGALHLSRRLKVSGVLGAVWQAWRQGRAASWLLVQPMESLLVQDLTRLRQQLNIARPTRYLAVLARLSAKGHAVARPPGV
ncbi:Coq4 family protein [Aquabacterium sp.]|uniref:Coq4 family protein n=1 Tax=Aquabacterium sp. TaxID=1872578 RepID=UPI003D6CD671